MEKYTKIDVSKDYARVRLKDPKLFEKGSFRTVDVGKKGRTKIVVGRLKGRRTTTRQSILIPRDEFSEDRVKNFKLRGNQVRIRRA